VKVVVGPVRGLIVALGGGVPKPFEFANDQLMALWFTARFTVATPAGLNSTVGPLVGKVKCKVVEV
jgi:hypothetical protein